MSCKVKVNGVSHDIGAPAMFRPSRVWWRRDGLQHRLSCSQDKPRHGDGWVEIEALEVDGQPFRMSPGEYMICTEENAE